MKIIFVAAALSAAALNVGMAVAPAHAGKIEAAELVVTGRSDPLPQAIVRYSDLNLASEDGRERLDNRINAAARMLCGSTATRDLRLASDIRKCHSAAQSSAAPQVTAAVAAFGRGERVALGDTGGLTLSAR